MLVGKYVFVIFLDLFVIRNFRGACSSIEMLKGYMARVSLVTPVLDDTLAIRKSLCCLLRVCVETVVSILFW